MGKIRLLPDDVKAKISAGEVVERPASVVKELVENSLDAGADEVKVEIDSKVIRVVDNGEGMDEEDALLCFQKHATSKIRRAEDLFDIRTFGFRGEALYSISAVSRVRLRTKTMWEELGTQVVVEGGQIVEVSKISVPEGTDIRVRDLFFNTPARRKFLSSPETEILRARAEVFKFALSVLNVRFVVKAGKEKVVFEKSRGILDTIKAIVGKKPEDFIDILFDAGTVKIQGFVFPNKIGLKAKVFTPHLVFVNSRPVKDQIVTSVITSFDFLKNSEFIIFVSCPPQFYDVNVSPTKIFLRWRSPSKMRDLVRIAVEEAVRHAVKPASYVTLRSEDKHEPPPPQEEKSFPKEERTLPFDTVGRKRAKVIWWKDIWAIVESEGKIYIVDVHAYAENKRYREIKKRVMEGQRTQKVAFEHRVLISPDKVQLLEEVGFSITRKNGEYYISEVPEWAVALDTSEIERITEESDSARILLDKICAQIACRTSFRSGDKISPEDLEKLFEDFDPAVRCPHGRPAVFEITESFLEKIFQRC